MREIAIRYPAILLVLLAGSLGHAADLPDEPIFSRHVVPMFSRLGCNSGGCHGAVQGKNGFRLGLFGSDSQGDHQRILRDGGDRN